MDDLAEARDHATRVVQSFTNERSLEDCRDWVLHVSDDQGDELFAVPSLSGSASRTEGRHAAEIQTQGTYLRGGLPPRLPPKRPQVRTQMALARGRPNVAFWPLGDSGAGRSRCPL